MVAAVAAVASGRVGEGGGGTLFQSRDSSVLQNDCGRRSLTETDRLRSLHERQSEKQEEEEEEVEMKRYGGEGSETKGGGVLPLLIHH